MIEEPQSPRKQSAGTSQTSLTAAAILVSPLWGWRMGVRVGLSPRVRRNSEMTVLLTTIK